MNHENLDILLQNYQVQPVGSGYVDCIVLKSVAKDFIDSLSKKGILVSGLTWWCHCKSDNTGCPHGMGGPRSRYYEGWFSEMPYPLVSFSSNQQAIKYIQSPNDCEILECFVPGLWLDIP